MCVNVAEDIDPDQSALTSKLQTVAHLSRHLFQLVEQFPIGTKQIAAFDTGIAGEKFFTLAALFSGGLHFFGHEIDTPPDIDVEIAKHIAQRIRHRRFNSHRRKSFRGSRIDRFDTTISRQFEFYERPIERGIDLCQLPLEPGNPVRDSGMFRRPRLHAPSLAGQASVATIQQDCRRRPGQQDRPYRLGHDGAH